MDKSKIIENPQLIGCLNCSPVPKTILPKDKILMIGLGYVTLVLDGCKTYNVEGLTVKKIEKRYAEKIKQSEEILLYIVDALHDETYQLDKESGNWYLIKQGMGIA